MAVTSLVVRLLGGFNVFVDGRQVDPRGWRLRKAQTLVKALALAPGQRLHRDLACELLWPGRDPGASLNNLHQALHSARRALAGAAASPATGLLVLRDEVLSLNPDGSTEVDLVDLERETATALVSGDADQLRRALEMGGDELLPEDRYDDWLGARRDDLARARRDLVVRLAASPAASPEEAVELLLGRLRADERDDEACRVLMSRLSAAGRSNEALTAYERLRAALDDYDGSQPDPQTRRLYRSLLASSFDERDNVVDEIRSTDRPIRRATSTLIGRERELGQLPSMVQPGALVTLTGPGGVGKTRLALEVASAVDQDGRFADGVRVVELSPLADPVLVPQVVASAFGFVLPSGPQSEAALAAQLAGREALLVLDTCEHLIEACAWLTETLLAGCPGVAVLATSREPLRIPAETVWRVSSLAVPDSSVAVSPAELLTVPAVRLFADRAAAARAGFVVTAANARAVAQICFRLDGVPLALELAAARIRVLTPRDLADRLDDALGVLTSGSRTAVTRQRTLHAAIDWSHELLSLRERRLFRRLAVFAGSFSIEAMEAICCAEEPEPLALLAELVDKSLVIPVPHGEGARYRLLDTIRQYGALQLQHAGEAEELGRRHRRWFTELAVANDPELSPGVRNEMPQALDVEHDNMRAALASGLAREPHDALRLAVALWQFWMARGHFWEGVRWLDDAVSANPEPTALRARALFALIALDLRRGESARMSRFGAESVDIHRRLGDDVALAQSLHLQGLVSWALGDRGGGESALDEAMQIARVAGAETVVASATHLKAVKAICRGDPDAAAGWLDESDKVLAGLESSDHPFFSVVSPGFDVADTDKSVPWIAFEETVVLGRRVAAAQAAAYVLATRAFAARRAGDNMQAQQQARAAADAFRTLGDRNGEALALNYLGNILRSAGRLADARTVLLHSLRMRRSLGDVRACGLSLSNIGLVALASGEFDRAQALVSRALATFERTRDAPGTAGTQVNLGLIALHRGDIAEARLRLERAEPLQRLPGSEWTVGWVNAVLASLAGSDEPARAAHLAVAGRYFDQYDSRDGRSWLARFAKGPSGGRFSRR